MEASLLTRVKSLIVDLIHLVLRGYRRQRLANSTDITTRRLRHRWKAEIVRFPLAYQVLSLDLSFIVGPSVQVRVAKCFLSYFRVFPEERTHVETLENVRRLKQRTSTHTIARYTVSVLSNAIYT